MSAPGWFSDPTGRFAQRWYDGSTWTADVVGANGAVLPDPLPEVEHPYAPPQPVAQHPVAPPPVSPPQPVAQQPVAPQPPPPLQWPAVQHPQAATGRYAPGVGLLIGTAGLVCVLLSLFVLKWADTDKGTFLDLSKFVRDAGSDRVNDEAVYLYGAWAAFVLFAVTVVLVLMAGLPLQRSIAGNTYARVIGAVVAGGAAVLQTVVVVHEFRGPGSPEFGAWLGVVGYLVAVGGLTLGARRRPA